MDRHVQCKREADRLREELRRSHSTCQMLRGKLAEERRQNVSLKNEVSDSYENNWLTQIELENTKRYLESAEEEKEQLEVEEMQQSCMVTIDLTRSQIICIKMARSY